MWSSRPARESRQKTSVDCGGSIEATHPQLVRSETNTLHVARYDPGNTLTVWHNHDSAQLIFQVIETDQFWIIDLSELGDSNLQRLRERKDKTKLGPRLPSLSWWENVWKYYILLIICSVDWECWEVDDEEDNWFKSGGGRPCGTGG